ncbi:hypothetical protein [Rhodococcus sp. NPDC058521]|uniref:hypothetical protein n=1 Tax=Rhodococcus sp. NPDC058521 TaxID=3346536 RepID=UPI003656CBAC
MTAVPLLFRALCDDASMFPPRAAQTKVALAEHLARRDTAGAALVGPLVVPAAKWSELAREAPSKGSVQVAVTFPDGPGAGVEVSKQFAKSTHITVVAVEFADPEDVPAPEFFATIEKLDLGDRDVYVEIPRAHRHVEFLASVTGTSYRAKLRTGGSSADSYPSESELAESILALVASGVSFKATGGLHRAIRHTDSKTGFEQHGFLNVLVATRRALEGATAKPIADALANRDSDSTVAELNDSSADQIARLRNIFHSFGTCSLDEPLEDLLELGLVPSVVRPS